MNQKNDYIYIHLLYTLTLNEVYYQVLAGNSEVAAGIVELERTEMSFYHSDQAHTLQALLLKNGLCSMPSVSM